MASGGEKKISFGFSKSIKKPVINKITSKETKHDFIECLDDKAIKVVGGVEKKNEPLVIPMLGSKTWHERILHKVNADIFEPKTEPTPNGDSNNVKVKQEVTEDASGHTVFTLNNGPEPMEVVIVKEERPEEPAKTLEEQAAHEILRDLQMQGERTEETNIPVVPLPEDESLVGKKESTLDDYEQVPIEKYGEAMLRGMGWQPGKGIGKNENMTQRTSTEVSRIIRPRTERVNYLDEESEDEIDFVHEESEESSEYSCSNESDGENEAEIERDENDESEEDEAESGRRKEMVKVSRKKIFVYGKNRHKWSTELPDPRGRRSRPVVHLPGRKGNTPCETPYEFWHLLFTDAMLDLVVQCTNAEIKNYRASNECTYPPAQSTIVTKIEIQAYIGLLYLGGYQRQCNVAVEELWSNEFGSNLYKSTMTEMRFKFISSRLRFDDKNTRNVRLETDALAPIRELWDSFIGNCQANYTASDFLTIDKQLLGFRGKFSARVYIKSKPAKYGIKIMTLNDAKTFYLYNAIPYIGRVSTERGESIPDYFVRNLCQPIYGTNRHITTDNWFTSVDIFNKMKDEFNLTMLGTMRKNKRHIPVSFTQTAAAGTTRYGYDGKNILLSYCPKKNKVVLRLSSYHKSVPEGSEGKPEMVQMYNEMKSGTDVFDFLCGSFTCARKTRRWPMRLFMGILDQAGVNACILYNFQCKNPAKDRRQFLRELVLELVTPHMRTRLNTPNLPRILMSNIRSILNEPENNINLNDKLEKRKRCSLCDWKKDRKTNQYCVKCRLAVCDEHRYTCCRDCL